VNTPFVKRNHCLCSHTCADDRSESYCGHIGFDDSVVTMINTSTATMIILGGGGGKPGGGGGR
jgi:hypothetical protein